MQCYTELLPPTAVTHAQALPLLHANANNLVVAKTSLLQVFGIEHQQSHDGADTTECLTLIGEYSLAGTVTAIARVQTITSKSGGDAVLLAFKDAKLSLVEWDPENHRISTISLHYYEAENVTTLPYGPPLAHCDSILTVDPTSRCAALKFGARQLAILPFRQHGDDLAGDEEDGLENGHEQEQEPTLKRSDSAPHQVDGETESIQTPYKPSFVLPLTALDPTLSHTVHLAFLHEYREPTLGIISAPVQPSYSLLEERKDLLTYTVFTLDLEQRASTNLITVPKLPSTLWKVIPLPLPIGGALLVGTNELVHIDQSGKANATAVNEFARIESDFGMADQSHLNLKLEDCSIEILDAHCGKMLIVTNDGSLATLTFQMLGRSISALNITRVDAEHGGTLVEAIPSCIAKLHGQNMFIGSEDGASSLLSWTQPTAGLSRKRSHAQMAGKDVEDEDEEAMDDDDDDLYDAVPEAKKRAISDAAYASDAPYTFRVRDTLPSIGPINQACIGRSEGSGEEKLELAAGTGRKNAGRLTFMHRDIVPNPRRCAKFDGAKGAWAVRSKNAAGSGERFDNLLFIDDGENTKVYDIAAPEGDDNGYTERNAPEFEGEGATVDVGTLSDGAHIVHCRRSDVRIYDANLGLDQIIPMVDEETDAEFNIVHVSISDPYVLVIRDDSSVVVLTVQGKEIEPIEGAGIISEKKWLSGSIYAGDLTSNSPALFLLSADSGMHIFSLPDLELRLAIPTLSHLPPVLSADAAQRRAGAKETLTELLVCDLGQRGVTSPFLVMRTAIDDVVLYEPFRYPRPGARDNWYMNLRFRKVPLSYIPRYNESVLEAGSNARQPPLKSMRIGEYSAISIPGALACVLLKESSTVPKVLEVRGAQASSQVTTLSPIHRAGLEHGFMHINDQEELQESQLPPDTWFGLGWSISQTSLGGQGNDVRHLAFHEPRGLYVVASCRNVDFYFAEEDGRHPEQDNISLRPQVPQYSVHLVSSSSHRILYTVEMGFLETVTALKVMDLEVSENSHEQKPLVVVSTAAQRGEDMPAKGTVIVYDIIDVVPEPGIPESGYRLERLAREESRGAITSLAGPFPGGFLGTAQGLKLMIRGLKEDGSFLPVAFLDAQSFTHTLKVLPGRGMWLAGDAWKGLWFGGFTEEPYKLTVLSKAPKTKMEVMSAEFLPFDGALYIVILDADMDLHVLQYDPENPKTVNGTQLLHRSTFHVGHFMTNTLLVPSSLNPFETQDRDMANGTSSEADDDEATRPAPALYHVLATSTSGSVGLITPLDEAAYRRLSALQTHLTSILEHAAGLNPRAYRAIESESFGGARGVVDGTLVRRIGELGATKRADVLARAGGDAWGLRSDLEIISGGGLGYL